MTSDTLILWLLLVPIIGAVWVMLLDGDDKVRRGAFAVSAITFLISLMMAYSFNWSKPHVQFVSVVKWVEAFGLSFNLGATSVGMWLILLTTFLMPLTIAGAFADIQKRVKEFYVWLLILEAAMLGVFVAQDLIFFYICFEFTLVPLFFLIGIFGGSQRLKAARIFFLYTFTGSMLTLAGLLYLAWFHASRAGEWSFALDHVLATAGSMNVKQQSLVFLALLAGFAVKVPVFPFHTWLPLAHTEAPTSGSVILAGVLLKLGTYAMLVIAIPLAPLAAVRFAPCIGGLAVIGILYTALICWVQTDIKKLIAYSSVSHLGFCVLGMFALNTIGMSGSVLYMVNHGLSTGALFLCVGMIYERLHSREMAQINGLGRVMPVWASFMVFFCLASVGLPGLNGFVGEFLTLAGAFLSTDHLGVFYAATAGVGMIFTAIYILYMVGKVVFGPVRLPGQDDEDAHKISIKDLSAREVAVLAPIAVMCLVLGLYPKPVLQSIEPTMKALEATVAQVQPSDETPQLALRVDR